MPPRANLLHIYLIPQRLPILQHVFDTFLSLGRSHQFEKVLALHVKQPILIHQAARIDIAAAHNLGDAAADVVVVLGDESALEHVDHRGLQRGDAGAAGDLYLARVQRRTVVRRDQCLGLFLRDVQQFETVHHDAV